MEPVRSDRAPRDRRYLRPWLLGALAWLVSALLLSGEYLSAFGARGLAEFGLVLSLLWLQFGFAGLFHALRTRQQGRVIPLVLVTLVPPGLLWGLNRALGWWFGG